MSDTFRNKLIRDLRQRMLRVNQLLDQLEEGKTDPVDTYYALQDIRVTAKCLRKKLTLKDS